VVREQGLRVDPATAVIKVDGMRVSTEESGLVHLVLNKPRGVVSTMAAEGDRPTLADYVPPGLEERGIRLFHVGRLDTDTEGLLLLTNDGELAHRLTHPSYGVPKTYLAEIQGPVARDVGRRLRAGVELDDGVAAVDSFRLVASVGPRVTVELVLHEGRYHVVRRLLDAVGHPVQRLVRTHVGPIPLGELRPGRTRVLSQAEVGRLYEAVGL
jgi:23S rRNA pseudouridine2605 synthase